MEWKGTARGNWALVDMSSVAAVANKCPLWVKSRHFGYAGRR